MSSREDLDRLASEMTPERLTAVLQRLQWQNIGGRRGAYSRWRRADAEDRGLLVPLNVGAGDFFQLMREAVYGLALTMPEPLQLVRQLDSRIGKDDEFKFRKEISTVAGTVPWITGRGI